MVAFLTVFYLALSPSVAALNDSASPLSSGSKLSVSTSPNQSDDPAETVQASSQSEPANALENVDAETPMSESEVLSADRFDRHVLVYDNLNVGRANPVGLASFLFAGYRYHLFNSDSVLWKPAFVQAGPQLTLTPDFMEGGVSVTAKPIAVLTLEARYMVSTYSPLLKGFHSFKTPYANYGPRHRIALDEANEGYTTYGGFLRLKALFEIQLGPFALQNELEVHRVDVALRDGDKYFYYSRWDTLFPNHGWGVANSLNLLAFTGFGLMAGFRYVATKPFHDDQILSSKDLQQRVGLLWGYQFMKKETGMVREILALGSAQFWFQHPYRMGQEIAQSVPYVIMGLSVKGDYPL
jgi:hypothetical protein